MLLFWKILIAVLSCTPLLAKGFQKPVDEAMALFQAFVPKIEKAHPDEIVSGTSAVSGDLDGDGSEDVVISFVLTPKAGGNMIVDRGFPVYLRQDGRMKVVGELKNLDCGAGIDKIEEGKIFVAYYECQPPYLQRQFEQTFVWKKGRAVPMSEKRKVTP